MLVLFGLSSDQFHLFNKLVVNELHAFECELYVFGPRSGTAFGKADDLDLMIETNSKIPALDQIIQNVEESNLGICVNFYYPDEFSEDFMRQLEMTKIHLAR